MIKTSVNFKVVYIGIWLGLLVGIIACNNKTKNDEAALEMSTSANYSEPHRPQFHFSPDSMWMNDPNGMVYLDGEYHLFYQYYPDSTVWGPMHWGHAISKDLVHWKHMPIALYPDEHGYIFSGSAVYDKNNTSGLGTDGNPPLVAIFTYHDPKGAQADRNDFQTQGIAYSTDKGRTWTKYENNPVLDNPGKKDFRDPKVSWNESAQQWIMTLAVGDHIEFYRSPDLKSWEKASEFGKSIGAHGGVWECPDLFQLQVEDTGESKWVLLVSINPGGPNSGSATQYFVGDFDGTTFTPDDTEIRWIDYGPDDYAGVTWSNVKDRRIFLGWMSNWLYANIVPTHPWRSAMTTLRKLSLVQSERGYLVRSEPVKELSEIEGPAINLGDQIIKDSLNVTLDANMDTSLYELSFAVNKNNGFEVVLSNTLNEKVVIGYDNNSNQYFIDRSNAGETDFHDEFPEVNYAPGLTDKEQVEIKLIVDVASVELFADNGLAIMTNIFFPKEPFTQISIINENKNQALNLNELTITPVKPIW